MTTIKEMKQHIASHAFSATLVRLYGTRSEEQRERYLHLLSAFEQAFPLQEHIEIYSAPGRSEIGGNHTDHQHGCVLAASIDLDSVAIVSPCNEPVIMIQSEGFSIPPIHLDTLAVQKEEAGTSAALIRGVLAGFVNRGYAIGGFHAYMNSEVVSGAGLSSSASFEVLMGTILSHLYNEGRVDMVTIAQISQFAENVYFQKPCGLMDQMACAVGGFVSIDFQDVEHPIINQIEYNIADSQHRLCIIDTKGSHADLTDEYAAIPMEMKKVANYFGCDYLREVEFTDFLNELPTLRELLQDRCVLRAMHFFQENDRALKEAKALRKKDFSAFLSLVKESGDSSFKYLQNVFSTQDTAHQGMSMALCFADFLLQGKGAVRVHGGGFAGTIQCFVPDSLLTMFQIGMENIFGEGSCHVLMIRPCGGIKVA